MNALMEKILSKKTSNDAKVKLTTKKIPKPKPVSTRTCYITADNEHMFYTYDGRALFFSETQEVPTISMPDETKKVVFLSTDNTPYIFLLSDKNKLECCDCVPSLSSARYTVTRNVVQIEKSEGKAFFMFRKDQHYFINECVFNGKRWIGQIVQPVIEGTDVKLFASAGSVFYTIGLKVFGQPGVYLGFSADFIHCCDDLMVAGIQMDRFYELKLLNRKTQHSAVDVFNIRCDEINKITGHGNIVVAQCKNDLYVIQVNKTLQIFGIKHKLSFKHDILAFDFVVDGDGINLLLLTPSGDSETSTADIGTNISTFVPNDSNSSKDEIFINGKSKVDLPTSEQETSSEEKNKQDASKTAIPKKIEKTGDNDFFYESLPVKKSSILREMESLSLTPQTPPKTVEQRPKNNLLEEVRATLNKKKLSQCDSPLVSDTKPVVDRFAIFKNEMGDGTFISTNGSMTGQTQFQKPVTEKSGEKPQPDKIAENPHIPTKIDMLATVEKDIAEIKQLYREILATVQSSGFKEAQIKSLLKSLMIEAVVPCVEACFNEMRVQMQVELRKICSSTVRMTEDPKIFSIKKHLSSGKPTQAIIDFLKLDDKEISANISLITPASIENVESKTLLLLLSRAYGLLLKSPCDVYLDLIYACLVDIEIDDLAVESLQDLSVILRNLKDIEPFNKEKCCDLCCIADILLKKIKKRAKRDISK